MQLLDLLMYFSKQFGQFNTRVHQVAFSFAFSGMHASECLAGGGQFGI